MLEINFELLKKSNPVALENIYAQYSRRIFWMGKKILDDEFIVENLVQDTFLKLWEHRDTIKDPLHILFFLQLVMKRSCYSHYSKPRNKFFRTVKSLESYENYQDYMAGYDPADRIANLKDQEEQQKFFDLINKVLPLISSERRRLIQLCLKYGFQYKAIAEVMGKGITETRNEIQRAIDDIKKRVGQNTIFENKQKADVFVKAQQTISKEQSLILKLRCEKKQSFEAIAAKLNLPQKQVHQEFIIAYKLNQLHY